MTLESTFFCVACSSVVDKEKAEVIFRTGFYKVSMQLGICKECEIEGKLLLDETSVMKPMGQLDAYVEDHTIY